MTQIEFFTRQKYHVHSRILKLKAASNGVLQAEVRDYLSNLTKDLVIGPFRSFLAHSKTVL